MSDSTGGFMGPISNWMPLVNSSSESRGIRFGVDESITEIREHFERQGPRLRYEGLAGKGAAGVVFRLVESQSPRLWLGSRGQVRRLALKRASSVMHEDLMRTEIKWLQVRRAQHLSAWRVATDKYHTCGRKRESERERHILTTTPFCGGK